MSLCYVGACVGGNTCFLYYSGTWHPETAWCWEPASWEEWSTLCSHIMYRRTLNRPWEANHSPQPQLFVSVGTGRRNWVLNPLVWEIWWGSHRDYAFWVSKVDPGLWWVITWERQAWLVWHRFCVCLFTFFTIAFQGHPNAQKNLLQVDQNCVRNSYDVFSLLR